MKLSLFQSLKTRITVITLLALLCCISLLTYFASRILREDMQRMLAEQQHSSVSFLAAEINFELSERLTGLKNVATTITPAMMKSPLALQSFLEQRPYLLGQFNAGAYFTDTQGVAIASVPSSVGRVGESYLYRDHVAAALKEKRAKISDVVIGKKLKVPVFAMAAPIQNGRGEIIGALVGVVDIGKPNFLDQFTRSSYGKSGYYLIEDPKLRLIITGTDKRRIMQSLPSPGENALIDRHVQGSDETGVTVSPLGIEVLATVARIPIAGWFVLGALPTAEAFAPLHNTLRQLWLGAFVLMLFSGTIVWWLLRRQLHPMVAASISCSTPWLNAKQY